MNNDTTLSKWCCVHMSDDDNNVTIWSVIRTVFLWIGVCSVACYFSGCVLILVGFCTRISFLTFIQGAPIEIINTMDGELTDILIGAVVSVCIFLLIVVANKTFKYKIISCKRGELDDDYE